MNNFLETVWTPEQAAAFSNVCTTLYEQVWLPLQVPAWQPWLASLQHAAADSHQAILSLGTFWFMTLRPVVILLYMLIQFVARIVWKYVFVQGISQQGAQYLTAAAKRVYRHQRSLSPEQVAMEVGAITFVLFMYQIYRALQRRKYFQRFSTYVHRQKSRATHAYRQSRRALFQLYDRSVQAIATTSLRAAVMTPHLLFGIAAVAFKIMLPGLVTWLACETACLQVYKSWYPFAATLLLLHEKKLARTTKAKNSFKERENYWLSFWAARAACQASKQLLFLFPFVERFGGQAVKELELFFFFWIFVIPPMIPRLPNAPEGRPLALLAPPARRAASNLYKSMNIFTDAWWQAWPVRWTSLTLDVAVLARVVTRDTSDRLRQVVANGQSYLIPAGTLLFPSFVSWYGVFFAQYCVPLRKSPNPRDGMLRYWIFQCLLSAVVTSMTSVLWWIPFSKFLTFALFLALLRDDMVERWFAEMIADLEAIGHYLGVVDEQKLQAADQQKRAIHQTWIARAIQLLLQKLPRAKELDDHSDESAAQEIVELVDHSDEPAAQEKKVVNHAGNTALKNRGKLIAGLDTDDVDSIVDEPDDAREEEEDDSDCKLDEPDDALPNKENSYNPQRQQVRLSPIPNRRAKRSSTRRAAS